MRFTRLARVKREKLLQCFTEDVTASVASRLALVNRKTANDWYAEFRDRLLVLVPSLPDLADEGRFFAYHERRIARFNGVPAVSARIFLLESRLRYQLKSTFRGALLGLCPDLLEY